MTAYDAGMPEALARTPLYDLHKSLGAKMVPFAGYDMPVQFPGGIIAEHLHTRAAASLFDVSHMGQVRLDGEARVAALEALVPGDIAGLAAGRMRYTVLTNEAGGIRDDLMVTNRGDHLMLVVNAACKADDIAHLSRHMAGVRPLPERALLALQGPAAAIVMARLAPGLAALPFMSAADARVAGIPCVAARSGYTGEDGFEISVDGKDAERLAQKLLGEPEVKPAGLGARDTLRLEAGLCLWGHDIDEATTPVEAGLAWTIAKRRRETGGYPGAARIARELAAGPARLRVGIKPADKAPAREETQVTAPDGRAIGRITSGGFGPSVGAPVAMGYVEAPFAAPGTALDLMVRGTARAARVAPLPFVPHRYRRP
jgi:aminomethyltransferase